MFDQTVFDPMATDRMTICSQLLGLLTLALANFRSAPPAREKLVPAPSVQPAQVPCYPKSSAYPQSLALVARKPTP